jgi:hypothetical protein
MPPRLSNVTKKTGADPINTLSPAPTQGSPELTTLPGEPHDDLRFYREQQEPSHRTKRMDSGIGILSRPIIKRYTWALPHL